MTIYKSFSSTHLDYHEVVYDRASNKSCHQSLESLQYRAAIAITGAGEHQLRSFFNFRSENPEIKTLAEKIMPVLQTD